MYHVLVAHSSHGIIELKKDAWLQLSVMMVMGRKLIRNPIQTEKQRQRNHRYLGDQLYQLRPAYAELLPAHAFSNRITAIGPNVTLNSKAAQTFALLVHELATNAAKYGALSLPEEGQVDIRWSIEGAGEEARFKFQ